MNSVSALTISFIEKRPTSAAATLAAMELDDAAAFLETIPTRYAATAISHIDAWPASMLLSKLAAPTAAALIRDLDYQKSAAIMRLTAEKDRQPILALLPERRRRDLQASLSFPEDTVGAMMTTAIVTLKPDQTTANAIERLQHSSKAGVDVVFVIDDAKKLCGVVTAAALLRNASTAPLSKIMDKSVPVLSARARIGSVASFDVWDDHACLPVLSRQKQLIGALSRRIARGQAEPNGPIGADAAPGSIAASMGNAFFVSAVALAELLVEDARPTRAGKQKGNKR